MIDGREWDTADSVLVVADLCDQWDLGLVRYDADGLGGPIKGQARTMNDQRMANKRKPIPFREFRGSSSLVDPEKVFPGTAIKAIDYFENAKAQAWWWLRQLFRNTYAVALYWEAHKKLPEDFDASKIIVIRGNQPERARLCVELSQPVRTWSKTGKMMIDKQPDDVASPNLADAVMMAFAPARVAIVVKDSHLGQS